MTNFSDMKRSSQKNVASLAKELERTANGESFKDDRFWSVTRDKVGNGSAVIRFLPAVSGEEFPWVRIWSHGFKGPNGEWYIENCPTTLNKKCPVCEANSQLWNSGLESDKNIARDRKRKLRYISNILVLQDPANRENEGKVFLYNYGKKIFDKLSESMTPQFEGEEQINPFDFWTGRNFKVRVKTVANYPNYDACELSAPSAIFDGDDAKLELLWSQQYPLLPFINQDQFKSYDDLQSKFLSVTSRSSSKPNTANTNISNTNNSTAAKPKPSPSNTSKAPFDENTSEDSNIDYFKSLAAEDE